MSKENKNSKQEFIYKNCENECGNLKELSDKVFKDSSKILEDIRHLMALLGSISMDIEKIMTLAHMVTLGCEELDVLCHLCYSHEYAFENDSFLKEFIGTYNFNMFQLNNDLYKLLEILPPETFEEYNCPKNENNKGGEKNGMDGY